ncbi:MAG TPA: nucleoside deaminase, partial [Firmicutes bacterium]|nr:nucleoside deaminase [Bacillota bacterium]
MNDEFYMRIALKEAEKAFKEDEVPVGAVIVLEGKIIAKAFNRIKSKKNPTGHAELTAIQ